MAEASVLEDAADSLEEAGFSSLEDADEDAGFSSFEEVPELTVLLWLEALEVAEEPLCALLEVPDDAVLAEEAGFSVLEEAVLVEDAGFSFLEEALELVELLWLDELELL